MEQYIVVGRILSSWGVRGQIKVEPLTDDIKRFDKLKKVFIGADDLPARYDVESVLYLKNAFVVLKLKNIDSPEQAEKFRGVYLKISREDAVKLPEGRYFICDIVGLHVFTESGEFLGKIVDVLPTGANDVYVVNGKAGNQILIPAIKEVVKQIDLENNKMIVRLMEGMA
ncbi:MAG: rRNA processing protein RimM [Thermoanaerobacteraceae bacterium]|nr:rRNA processing protein RimM [Thermoanaerobacteraceae bacterium]MDN5313192.1 rRNA processing protein RimM [Thermoanaerobacteraceae bacterium]